MQRVHATNSRMGPSSPVRAPFAQVFLAEESPNYIGWVDPRRLKAVLVRQETSVGKFCAGFAGAGASMARCRASGTCLRRTRHRAEERFCAGFGLSWAPEWAPGMQPRLLVRRARRRFV